MAVGTDPPQPSPVATALHIAAFGRELHSALSADPSGVWSKVTRAATTMLPMVDHASITVIGDRPAVQSRAATDRHAEAFETAQESYQEGPGVYAAREQRPQRIDDLSTEDRWPTFVVNAAATPIRAIVSFPLFQHGHIAGALNLHADTPEAFLGEGGQLAEMFSCSAAVIAEAAHRDRQLHQLMANRDVVGQAKGVLMERFGVDARAAFAMLVQLADRDHLSVPAVARQMVRRANVPAVRRASR